MWNAVLALDDEVGAGESFVGVAASNHYSLEDIVGSKDDLVPAESGLDRKDGLELFVFDADQTNQPVQKVFFLGCYQKDRLFDVADLGPGEQGLVFFDEGDDV